MQKDFMIGERIRVVIFEVREGCLAEYMREHGYTEVR